MAQAIAGIGLTPYEHYLRHGRYERIPGFAVGTNYVPYDMTARIHQGERIVPAADNRELMQVVRSGADAAGEMRAMRDEMRQLYQATREAVRILADISNYTRDSADGMVRIVDGREPIVVRTTGVTLTTAATPGQ